MKEIKDNLFRILTLNRVVNDDPVIHRATSLVEDLLISGDLHQVLDLSDADLILWYNENCNFPADFHDLSAFVRLISICRKKMADAGWIPSNTINLN